MGADLYGRVLSLFQNCQIALEFVYIGVEERYLIELLDEKVELMDIVQRTQNLRDKLSSLYYQGFHMANIYILIINNLINVQFQPISSFICNLITCLIITVFILFH